MSSRSLKKAEVLRESLNTSTWRELETHGKFDKNAKLSFIRDDMLILGGRYFELYLSHDVYAELRGSYITRTGLNKRKNALKNAILAVLEEFFPKNRSFPKFMVELRKEGVTREIKGREENGWQKESGTACRGSKVEAGELQLSEKQTEELEVQIASTLEKTDYAKFLLRIKRIGIVTLAACLGDFGDPTRFSSVWQMPRMGGYNFVEDSSGKNTKWTENIQMGKEEPAECTIPDGADNGDDKWRDEITLRLLENEGESSSEEDAGTDCSQQEDTDDDPYACKEDRELRFGESILICSQSAAEDRISW